MINPDPTPYRPYRSPTSEEGIHLVYEVKLYTRKANISEEAPIVVQSAGKNLQTSFDVSNDRIARNETRSQGID